MLYFHVTERHGGPQSYHAAMYRRGLDLLYKFEDCNHLQSSMKHLVHFFSIVSKAFMIFNMIRIQIITSVYQ